MYIACTQENPNKEIGENQSGFTRMNCSILSWSGHFDKGVEPHVIWVHVNNHQVLRELSAAQNYSIPTNGEPHIQCAYRINPKNRETQKN
jgi:hypothetical protein